MRGILMRNDTMNMCVEGRRRRTYQVGERRLYDEHLGLMVRRRKPDGLRNINDDFVHVCHVAASPKPSNCVTVSDRQTVGGQLPRVARGIFYHVFTSNSDSACNIHGHVRVEPCIFTSFQLHSEQNKVGVKKRIALKPSTNQTAAPKNEKPAERPLT